MAGKRQLDERRVVAENTEETLARKRCRRLTWEPADRTGGVGGGSRATAVVTAPLEWMARENRSCCGRREEEEEKEEVEVVGSRCALPLEGLPSTMATATEMGARVMALVDLSVSVVARHVDMHAWQLHVLPPEVALMVWRETMKRTEPASSSVLQAFARAFWTPCHVDLSAWPGRCYSSSPNCLIRQLEAVSNSLVRLNLSACTGLQDLRCLNVLKKLQCLNLRDCHQLNGSHLADLQELQELRCLNLENIYAVDDMYAAFYLPRIPNLVAINLDGTAIGDPLIESATYGLRLQKWSESSKKPAAKASGDFTNCRQIVNHAETYTGRPGGVKFDHDGSKGPINDKKICSLNSQYSQQRSSGMESELYPLSYSRQNGLSTRLQSGRGAFFEGWPICSWEYLSLKRTRASNNSISHLLALQDMVFLDVRQTEVTGKALQPLKSKFKMITPPNNWKVLSRSNSLLISTDRGVCGCEGLRNIGVLTSLAVAKPAWMSEWEQEGIHMLLSSDSGGRKQGLLELAM